MVDLPKVEKPLDVHQNCPLFPCEKSEDPKHILTSKPRYTSNIFDLPTSTLTSLVDTGGDGDWAYLRRFIADSFVYYAVGRSRLQLCRPPAPATTVCAHIRDKVKELQYVRPDISVSDLFRGPLGSTPDKQAH